MLESIREIFGRMSLQMSEKEFFEAEIAAWKASVKRREMIDGERYFRGDQDILQNERTAIGKDGRLKRVDNLPNNKIVDNQYQRLVNQKVDYLLGKRFSISTKNDEYKSLLNNALGEDFHRTLKGVLRDCINMGVGWLYADTDNKGNVSFKRIPAYEMIAFPDMVDERKLDRAVRLYEVEGYKGKKAYVREMVEIYSKDKVEIFELVGGHLEKEEEHLFPGRDKIPFVAFRYNEKEIPLIKRVKSLQDALNKTLSDYANNLQQDSGNSILVLQNYDGTDLGEFRQNLALYNAVKVRSVDGASGDIKVLETSFDTKSYTDMIALLKNAIVENAMGYDMKSDKLGNNPNQLVVKSMFSDMDLDVCEAEVEFKSAFLLLKEFIDECLLKMGKGDFSHEKAELIFNRDFLVNEAEMIENCIKSRELLSDESVLLKHPWVSDTAIERERLGKEND